ncbi:Phosphoadenosine phosphosulfate reductase family [Acididesulfobacillus acetoxydans]|uniref:PAPS reductase/FAD synthetase protein n=1 Tax=Acididesulfobacillus acetoxydans TaxID=1561005 RepID=A0A8S0Y4L5_9FIRM|nr:phosphoadenosine phosphosulfate reductase family protein [Acididesulfobacillus acetoxydans]CAA7603115.1 Phosphoadenosine phosphosulfate reductase family [Acididesulfobacillus acetoxydans]CEJ05647.1 PAPS reductase/FAD synthetase protein [Acididesulfobacillus acetoxydans]
MYAYEWTRQNGIYALVINGKVQKEIRPVFKEELDYFGMNHYWTYPDTKAPLLWAEGIRRYVIDGRCVAEAKGGGFYSKPQIVVNEMDLTLEPIDVKALWKQNEEIMFGLENTAKSFIRKTYNEYAKQGYAFVVAFSGGKDSLVLLDLVSRALSPGEFYVIFNNTGMELSCTIEAVEKAKRHWPDLRFLEAKSHLNPEKSWGEFGPPGRRMRWCCSVHKSVPTILTMREITGNYDVKAVVFDGVRREESAQRANYIETSVGAKNINQINCSPILKWSTGELYLYLIHRNILFNQAYRQGLFRVGCMVCPMSSSWWDGITNDYYGKELAPLLKKVEKYAELTKPPKEQKRFIEQGGWKARMGGRGLPNGGNRVSETINGDAITFHFSERKQDWLSVVVILGPIVERDGNKGIQLIANREYAFCISDDRKSVSYSPYKLMDRFVISHLRGIANKVAYCFGCKACMVQCPCNAFLVDDSNHIFIREDKCVHCSNCIEFTGGKGCLAAKSLSTTGGSGMELKGMNRYQHFGLRREFLEHFFDYKSECFNMGVLGNRQYDALKVWLKEAELLYPNNKGDKSGTPTALFEKLEPLGPFNPVVWAIIWTNLAYNSVICKWYMLYAPVGEVYEKNDLVFMLGDDYSQSTRDNAITALLETFRHSPIGSTLKQGIPISTGASYKFSKSGWESPNAVAILFSLYKWAEATGEYTFSLHKTMIENRRNANWLGVDPGAIFGISDDNLKEILQSLALQFEEFIRVSFQVNLDNVILCRDINLIDILNLAQ